MIVAIYRNAFQKELELRITQLGFSCRLFDGDTVEDLSGPTAEVVYLVPSAALDRTDWPEMRVRLATAGRNYIVAGQGLDSHAIVVAMRDGAYDVIDARDPAERWQSSIAAAANAQKLWLQLYGGGEADTNAIIVGESTPMRSLKQTIERLGPTNATVLVLGESGAGKEKVAQALHETSGRKKFVALNCAAIPKDLIEAELFGAEKGAYTGADRAREGMVEQADGGTLFLDEIGELSMDLQPKFLRFLETRVARRVGGKKEYTVDVRIVSATNRNLDFEIAENNFRADLYYRLSEITLRIPPLSARLDDVPLLALPFLKAASERFGKHFDSIEPELIQKFQGYAWPGNVREFKSAIDRIVILHDGPVMRKEWWDPPVGASIPARMAEPAATAPSSLPTPASAPQMTAPAMSAPVSTTPSPNPAAPGATSGLLPGPKQRQEMARQLLQDPATNLSSVAAQLGIHPTTLYRWRKQGKV